MSHESLRKRRSELEKWLDESGRPSRLSASRYLLHQKLQLAFEQNVKGRVLEVGAGGSPFSHQLRGLSNELVTLDIQDRYGRIDVIADVQDMAEVESNAFDVVVCTQVLEHVPFPHRALAEMRRVLNDDGVLILSAPHLSMIHEAPNDYQRFTNYGLESHMLDAGFVDVSVESTGGLIAFLTHPVSVMAMTAVVRVRWLRNIVCAVNYWLLVRVVSIIDLYLGVRSLYPLDHVAVAKGHIEG